MDRELVVAVDAVAEGFGVSRGEVIRRAVERDLRAVQAAVPRRAVEQALEPKWTPPSGGRNVGRRAAEPEVHPEAVEQALGSSGRAGVRGRVPAPVPAEQPAQPEVGISATEPIRIERGPEVPRKRFVAAREDELDFPERGYSAPRVRSSSEARPFRPVPKKGEK